MNKKDKEIITCLAEPVDIDDDSPIFDQERKLTMQLIRSVSTLAYLKQKNNEDVEYSNIDMFIEELKKIGENGYFLKKLSYDYIQELINIYEAKYILYKNSQK